MKPAQPQNNMSTSDLGSLERVSSDGTSTDPRDSEGLRTEITSIMETDTDPDDLGTSLEIDNGSDRDSVYAPSHYPRMQDAHRVEMPFSNGRRMEHDAVTM
jgi:hypothetical protein